MLEDLLGLGIDDWNSLVWFAQEIETISSSRDIEARTTVGLGLVALAIFQGLMVPGDLTDAGFEPWGISPAEAFERIARGWLQVGVDDLLPGAVAWMANTPLGDEIARAFLEHKAKAGAITDGSVSPGEPDGNES